MIPFPISFPPRHTMMSDLKELGVQISEKQLNKIGRFAGILIDNATRVNLMGPGEKNRLWRRHILESIPFSYQVNIDHSVIDIGSGNGFPGIVLSILGYRMNLLEPRRKRYLFLNRAVNELNLENCSVIPLRLEELDFEKDRKQFVARAVAPPSSLLKIIRNISGEGSILVCRQPEIRENCVCENFFELKSPPLDRGGFMVQYRV